MEVRALVKQLSFMGYYDTKKEKLLHSLKEMKSNLSDNILMHLIEYYGSEAKTVLEFAKKSKKMSQNIIKGLPYIFAEVEYCVRHEMAETLSDGFVS